MTADVGLKHRERERERERERHIEFRSAERVVHMGGWRVLYINIQDEVSYNALEG